MIIKRILGTIQTTEILVSKPYIISFNLKFHRTGKYFKQRCRKDKTEDRYGGFNKIHKATFSLIKFIAISSIPTVH